MNRRRMLALLGLLPVAAVALPVLKSLGERGRPRRVRPAAGFHDEYFPNVVLRTHENRKVRLYDDLLRGKNVLIQFFRTDRRDGRSVAATENLLKLQKLLGDRCGRDAFLYSFSLAPERDTPARLRAHHQEHRVGPGWTFLTGSPRNLELCRLRFGFAPPARRPGRDRAEHSNIVLLGNEPHQRWMVSAALTRPEVLLDQLNRVAGLKA